METLKEIAMILGRIITILPLLLIITLFMGRRAIGELPVFDFLIIITLGAVVGADIADPNINHLYTAISIIVIGILQRLVAQWKIANRKFGKLITYEPVVVVQNGKLIYKNLKKIRYSVDDILQMLREKDVFNLDEVEVAILEENGSISVYKKPRYQNATKEDTGSIPASPNIAYPVMIEGKIHTPVLETFNVTAKWLESVPLPDPSFWRQPLAFLLILFYNVKNIKFSKYSIKNMSKFFLLWVYYILRKGV